MSENKEKVEARRKALALLGRREHSAQELRRKLSHLSLSRDDLDALIVDLQSTDWQSDRRFAEQYARSRVSRGWGPLHIVHRLRERGISDEVIDQLELDEDWQEHARAALVKRFGVAAAADITERAKKMRFLKGRGFCQHHGFKAMGESGEGKLAP